MNSEKNETKRSLNEFWAAIFAAAIGSYVGKFITYIFNLHWIFLGILVAVLFLLFNKVFLMLLELRKNKPNN